MSYGPDPSGPDPAGRDDHTFDPDGYEGWVADHPDDDELAGAQRRYRTALEHDRTDHGLTGFEADETAIFGTNPYERF